MSRGYETTDWVARMTSLVSMASYVVFTATPDAATRVSVPTMDAVTIMFLIAIALSIDYMSIGPDSLRDKIAFAIALPAIYGGWDGSTLDTKITDGIQQAIQSGLRSTGTTHSTAQMAQAGMRCLVFFVLVYAIGALMPEKWSKKCGRWAQINFKAGSSDRLNKKLWGCAIVLGLLGGQLGGLSGSVLKNFLSFMTGATVGLPAALIGSI